jgi:hypothetical protein
MSGGGIFIGRGKRNKIINCVSIGNGGHGFDVPHGTEMLDNLAAHNQGDGIHVRDDPAADAKKHPVAEAVGAALGAAATVFVKAQ